MIYGQDAISRTDVMQGFLTTGFQVKGRSPNLPLTFYRITKSGKLSMGLPALQRFSGVR